MKTPRIIATAVLSTALLAGSIAPAHAAWIDHIEPSSWVCKIWPVFC